MSTQHSACCVCSVTSPVHTAPRSVTYLTFVDDLRHVRVLLSVEWLLRFGRERLVFGYFVPRHEGGVSLILVKCALSELFNKHMKLSMWSSSLFYP